MNLDKCVELVHSDLAFARHLDCTHHHLFARLAGRHSADVAALHFILQDLAGSYGFYI